jgi:hypothetical protein
MPPTRGDLELAIAAYWATKAEQEKAAIEIGSTAEGSSVAVRGGGHFNPVANLIARFFLDAGYPPESIGAKGSKVVLPSFYRPTKRWDLVVAHEGILVAAFELKALGGDSAGKNYNNRIEEALGSSADLRRAHSDGLVGKETPWFGYLYLIDDETRTTKPVRVEQGYFESDPVWHGRSYQRRFDLTGKRLLDEGWYDALCYLVSSRESPGPQEPVAELDWQHFSSAINARIAYLSGVGYP